MAAVCYGSNFLLKCLIPLHRQKHESSFEILRFFLKKILFVIFKEVKGFLLKSHPEVHTSCA